MIDLSNQIAAIALTDKTSKMFMCRNDGKLQVAVVDFCFIFRNA